MYLATLACCLWESVCCESLSHASGVPAPFGKGAFAGSAHGQFPTVISSKSLLPLQCPVSAACPPNLFTIHSSLFTKNARYRRPAKAPRAIAGVPRLAEAGGFRGQGHRTSYRFPLPYSLNFPCSLGKGGFFVCGFFENFVNLKKNNYQKKDWGSSQKHTQNHTILEKTDLPPLPILGVKMGN